MKKVVVFTRSVLLLSTFLLTVSLGKGIHAKAATYDKAVNLEMITKDYTRLDRYVTVDLEGTEDHIANLKSSNKHLRAMVSSTIRITNSVNTEIIDMYATKKGKYKLTFDIVDSLGNVKSQESIKVYVKTPKENLDSFKSIKVGKTDLKKKLLKDDYTTQAIDIKKSGKLKIKMNKGCKLKDIHVSRYKRLETPKVYENGDRIGVKTEYVEIKNGAFLELSDAECDDESVEESDNKTCQRFKSTYVTTRMEIAYVDKKGISGTVNIVLRSVNR